MNLHDYDLIIINSSGGKDSQASLTRVVELAGEQRFPRDKISVVHADLGREEWPGVKALAGDQAAHYGLKFYSVERTRADGSGDSILAYTERRGKWPSSTNRWCTSDFKRGPCLRAITRIARDFGKPCKILNVFGFRSEESPARSKKIALAINKKASNKKRQVFDWLPIQEWSEKKVWDTIKRSGVPHHYAYDLGMPRLSCCFCIFAPTEALVIAGKANPELLADYVAVEERTGHSFKAKQSIKEIQYLINLEE